LKIFSALWLAALLYLPAMAVCQEGSPELAFYRADSLRLHNHEVWKKLLHYEESLSGNVSAINSKDFFLSEVGQFNSRAELEATLYAFSQVAEDPNYHAQCRFPARYLWLQEKLNLSGYGIESINCPNFNQWSLDGSTESISIVFATGYLGNPASYYGHTLLKLNSRDQDKQTSLLDVSINYGAIVPDGEGPIPYIFKGIFGGYSGGFSHIEYYFHTHNYGENELRDLWEYKLDLPQNSVDLIIAHAWEVLGKEYTYYFFRRNCAYRMAELVEIVTGIDIIPETPLFTIPQSLIKKISEATLEGRPLMNEVIFHPSRQSSLYRRYNLLTSSQKLELIDIIEKGEVRTTDYDILDTLLDYYQFVSHSEKDDQYSAKEMYRQALAARYTLPPHASQDVSFSTNAPHAARSPSLVSFGLMHSSQAGLEGLLRIRPAYYDQLDSDAAHVANSTLSMGDMVFAIDDSRLRLYNFDVINIESANTKRTSLPGDNGDAWSLRAGIQKQNLACSNCLIPRFQGAWGKVLPLSNGVNFTGLIGGGVQENKQNNGSVFVSVATNILYEASQNVRAKITVSYENTINGNRIGKVKADVSLRYRLSSSRDLRLSYSKDKAESLSLTFGTYW
jgi:hypothetical protein